MLNEKNVSIPPNWEPKVTTSLSHLGKHYPRSQYEANSAAFHHKTQTGKMQVPKHTNEGDPVVVVSGELLCPHLKQMEHPGLLSCTPGTISHCVFCQGGGEA